MLSRIDMWLIESVFELFSHWWQKTISYKQDCFWWAKISVIVALLAVLIAAVAEALFLEKYSWFFVFSIAIPMSCLLWFRIRKDKKEVYAMLQRGCSNYSKTDTVDFYTRLFLLSYGTSIFFIYAPGIFVESFPNMVGSVSLIVQCFSIVSCLYFLSCDPLPPSTEKSRLQKWAASLKEKLTLAPSPILSPAS